jgi:hypothetical protein
MAGDVTRCFGNVRKLREFDPEVLCAALRHFQEDLAKGAIHLPGKGVKADKENMPYETISKHLVGGEVSDELDDLLFYVCELGNEDGWENVKTEAKENGLRVDERSDGLRYTGCVLQAWLTDWPHNKALLEKSAARTQMCKLSAYVYCPMTSDLREHYREPDRKGFKALEARIAEHFRKKGHGKGARLIPYDFPDEIWFMVKYPGRVKIMQVYSDGEEDVDRVIPGKFDAVVYDKVHGFLRMNTKNVAEQSLYRMAVGDLLFGGSNVFRNDKRCVTLEPLKGESVGIFSCKDLSGAIKEVELSEVQFTDLGAPGKTITWKWNGGRNASLDQMPLWQMENGVRVNYPLNVLPPLTDHVLKAVFKYTLRNSRGRTETLTVHAGNRLRYARDSDAAKIGEWLLLRKFLKVGFPVR